MKILKLIVFLVFATGLSFNHEAYGQNVGVEEFQSAQFVNKMFENVFQADLDVCQLKPQIFFWSDLEEPFTVRIEVQWDDDPGPVSFLVAVPPAVGLANDNDFSWTPNDPFGLGIADKVREVNGELPFKKNLTVSVLWHQPNPHAPDHEFDGDELTPPFEFEWIRKPPAIDIPDIEILSGLWPF